MIFSKVILLLTIFNIDHLQAIKTASLRIDDSAGVRTDNLLTEFMTDLKSFSFEKLNPHRLIILGKTPNVLQSTKVFLETGTPYYIGTKPYATTFFRQFGADGVVLFFIDGYNNSEINSTFARLPNDYKCRAMIISTKEDTTDQSIATTILSAVERKLRNVMFARFDDQVIKIYGKVKNANCKEEITLLNKWTPRKGFRKNTSVIGHDMILNEHGCPMFVSTFETIPTMMLREDENKSMRISGGIEGRLIETIADYLNMVPKVKVPSVEEKLSIAPGGIISGIIGDVAREEASFGIGQIRPTPERAKMVDFTTFYNHECIVWTVPLRTEYNYSVVTSEFSPITWIMVIISVVLCCGLAFAVPKLKIGRESSLNVFDVIAMTLNYPIPRPPTSLLCKLFFLLYLNYSRIISTAYTTSLSSILTATTPDPSIVDEDGILAAGLRAAGSQGSLSMLADQVSPNSTIAELINRYEVITSLETALKRLVDRQDIAFLRHRSTVRAVALKAFLAGREVEYYSLPHCVISYHSVMVTPKGSRLTGEVDNVILRVGEAGLSGYWKKVNQPFTGHMKSLTYYTNTLSQLESIFVLYLFCLIPAFMAFAVELIAFKLNLSNWFTR